MLTQKDIDRLLKANPELVAKKLFSCQQRISFLLELLNEMNEQMLQIRLKELAEEDKA